MLESGLFILLFDKKTLRLYLDRGVYGFLMPPVYGHVSSRSNHYAALADYACARKGTHVFFFLERRIVYAGQIVGPEDYGAFYLNGNDSPLGQKANAPLCWDESDRSQYESTDEPGIFRVPERKGERCQPYLLRFEDRLGLRGYAISSDQLYMELGLYPYPLPTNSIQNMSFCTMTPRETELALSLLRKEPAEVFPYESDEPVYLRQEPVSFEPAMGVPSLREGFERGLFVNEAHLEFSVIANPELLPKKLRPDSSTICRQVPISPFKPYQMDRADVCYYSRRALKDGTIPDTIIELKWRRAGKSVVEQVTRYLDWLYKILGRLASEISIYVLAPSFTRDCKRMPEGYEHQCRMISVEEGTHS